MKNLSIRFILLVLLVFVGPTIQGMIVETQQKGQVNVPISDTEQSSLDDELEGFDGQFICSLLKSSKHFNLPSPFRFQASDLSFSLPDNIVLPPPKLLNQ